MFCYILFFIRDGGSQTNVKILLFQVTLKSIKMWAFSPLFWQRHLFLHKVSSYVRKWAKRNISSHFFRVSESSVQKIVFVRPKRGAGCLMILAAFQWAVITSGLMRHGPARLLACPGCRCGAKDWKSIKKLKKIKESLCQLKIGLGLLRIYMKFFCRRIYWKYRGV